MQEVKIVQIPQKMEKFYGKGTMLHPDIVRVKELIDQIPPGKIATIDLLAKKMAMDVGANVSCPMRTGNAIKRLANDFQEALRDQTPFWRVVRTDKALIKTGAYDFCAAKLEAEGFELIYVSNETIKVKFELSDLMSF